MAQTQPILIAGAGPCGLMTGLVLAREGVRSIIVERASRDKLLADVGSGYDIQPTAMRVLRVLNLPFRDYLYSYAGMHQLRLDTGDSIRAISTTEDMGDNYETWSARRSELQKLLVEALDDGLVELRCGAGVSSYIEGEDEVKVSLTDGTEICASALLACDGIKSAVRKQLHQNEGDELQYCGVRTWWGKLPVESGSKLEARIAQTQTHASEGLDFLWFMGTGASQGCLMGAKSGPSFLWSYSCLDALPPGEGDDLTRRGGITGDAARDALVPKLEGGCELARAIVAGSAPSDITMVGLCDRKRLDLSFSSPGGRVALLGDAAHPQTPFLSQGASSSIVDSFVCATRLARQGSVQQAIRSYDSDLRRQGMRNMVEQARKYALRATSNNVFTRWAMRFASTWLPPRFAVQDMLAGDTPNKDFFEKVLADFNIQEEAQTK